MKTKLLAALFLSFSISSNVFAATVPAPKSPAYPVNGTYNISNTLFCSVDANAGYPSGYPTTYFKSHITQHNFTPDTTRTFSNWVTYVMGLTPGMPNPNLSFNSIPDPSSTTVPQAKLVETPIQWGTNSKIALGSEVTAPYSTPTLISAGGSNNYWIFTSFTYSNPANINNARTGYALRTFGLGDTAWSNSFFFFNTLTPWSTTNTSVANNFMGSRVGIKTFNAGATSYPFNCTETGNATK